jgi:hypothetical protein
MLVVAQNGKIERELGHKCMCAVIKWTGIWFSLQQLSAGKGDLAPFWLCSWVEGSAPRNIAPILLANDTT